MAEKIELKGQCLCGAVHINATPAERHVDACHCSMCRQWGGSPALTVNCSDGISFSDESAIGVFASSEWAERGFCKTCGTHLFYRFQDKNFYSVPAGLFGDLDGFDFNLEIYTEEQPALYAFAGERKRMTGEEVVAFFGGE